MLVIAGYFFAKEKLFHTCSIIFGIFIVCAALNLGLDIWGSYLLNNSTVVPLWLNYAVNTAYIFIQAVLPPLFMIYALALTGCLRRKLAPFMALLMLPALVCFGLILSTAFTGVIFYFTPELQYVHAPAFNLLYGLPVLYLGLGVFFVCRYRQRVTNLQFYTILVYVVILLTSMVVQYFFPELLITGVATTLSILMMFLTLQNPDTYIDKATGLYGRPAFFQRIGDVLGKKARRELVVVHLTDMRQLGNLLGLEGSALLLSQITAFLSTLCKKKELFRVEDDRCVLLLKSGSQAVAQYIHERFADKWRVMDSEIFVPATVCRLPQLSYAATLQRLADMIEQAVELRSPDVLVVDEHIATLLHRKQRVEQALRQATLQEESGSSLQVYYQPIYSLQKGQTCALEALLRLEDAELGMVPPGEFIEIAEKTGLIHRVGEIVLERTCEFLQRYRLWEIGIHTVDVNLSTVQCLRENLVERICEILARYEIPRDIINFEITESTAIASEKQVSDIMRRLIEFGVSFSMDDYGEGYWGSQSILRFPFRTIKLDKSLLWNGEKEERAYILYQATVEMLERMNMQIVAEGVETQAQLEMARELGVDFIQGYYCSRPLPEAAFLEYLRTKNELAHSESLGA